MSLGDTRAQGNRRPRLWKVFAFPLKSVGGDAESFERRGGAV